MSAELNSKLSDFDENRLRTAVEARRSELPDDLFEYYDSVEAALARRMPPQEFRERGLFDALGKLGRRLGKIVLEQLHKLVCTAHEDYDDIRNHGRVLTDAAIAAIGVKVASLVGVSVAVASAATAFGILLIARAGLDVFCHTFTPGDQTE